jgi:hypothetical protein
MNKKKLFYKYYRLFHKVSSFGGWLDSYIALLFIYLLGDAVASTNHSSRYIKITKQELRVMICTVLATTTARENKFL